jgi:hypothetical protein
MMKQATLRVMLLSDGTETAVAEESRLRRLNTMRCSDKGML